MAANLPRPKRTSTKQAPEALSKEAAFYRGGKDRSGDTVELHPKDLCPNPFNRHRHVG
ncbi:hypothetical protein NRF20_01290 [Streptomyces sp. R-74717]|uniref:hypothetical protein n=1 Tax=Streptomyces TaxID=1883 RepID=UPI0037BB5215